MIELKWFGPFALGESALYPHFRTAAEYPGFNGLYCWCVEVAGVFLPTYIGKSKGRTTGVIKRVADEVKDARVGKYADLLGVDEFRAGRRLVLRGRYSDASEKRGENNHIHKQHLAEYNSAVDACVVFFAREPECGAGTSILEVEASTIARVQSSGLDVVPTEAPSSGHFEMLLSNEPASATLKIRHTSTREIRGLTCARSEYSLCSPRGR